ncbi:selenium-dependent xanthine dehydrogenase [bacterium]|nr:selenium-dependent xanthine dehydrogenase [bacterium]
MITFTLNGEKRQFSGEKNTSLLHYLRETEEITSTKDGCSGQGACGACLLELSGKAVLSCRTTMAEVDNGEVVTIEGFDPYLKDILAKAFVKKGAVQCGFCTPGFLSRTRILLESNPNPTREQIKKALSLNICRCTGYVKIIDAILYASEKIAARETIELNGNGKVGTSLPKIDAYQRALGQSPFISDMKVEGMLFGALKFSDFPRAEIIDINISKAEKLKGVHRIFLAEDIPGDRITGHLLDDWPLMICKGETTRYIGDVIAGVVADSEEIAREACSLIDISYHVLEPLTDMQKAESSLIRIHEKGNLLKETVIRRGEPIETVLENSDFSVKATYQTQFVEHGFLETEAALAQPWDEDGIKLYVQSQGIYEDQSLVSRILGLPIEKVDVTLVPSGGAFGGKEDLTVQGHAALFTYHLRKPVRVRLTRDESIRMHPKRHPLIMQYELGCSKKGRLTGLKARIIGDTGAYASLGPSVMSRAAGHAAGGYHVPSVDVISKAVYTNNIPCGAMRGFGVNQVTFAMECAIDELCEKGGFDRWQFRYDNALQHGLQTTTGQVLKGGVGLKETLLAVKDDFYEAKYVGIAVGIKNIGFGNGLVDESETRIDIKSETEIILSHGWTEMGQGIDTVATQVFCQETGLDPSLIKINHSTTADVIGGTTTASRGTFLLGNSVIAVAKKLNEDLKKSPLKKLVGRTYRGTWRCDWTKKPEEGQEVVSHVTYGYATQVVILDENGAVEKIIAAHDVGRAINPVLLEGQIEGGVVMGLGYAFSENLPLESGILKNTKFGKLGIPRINKIPEIDVRIIEVEDPHGPYGAKGIGEIGLVPTAPAAANALYQFDRQRRYRLPLKKV